MKRAHPFPPQMFVELLLRARPRPVCQTEARKRQPFRSVAKTTGRGAGRRTSGEREKQRRERGAGGGLGCGCGRLQPSTSGPMGLSEKVTSQQKSEGHDGVSGPGISPVR